MEAKMRNVLTIAALFAVGGCESSTGPTNDPPPVGSAFSNPAPIGVPVTVELRNESLWGNGDLTLTLLETVSGAEALQRVIAGNQFNDEPPAGREYILARIRVSVANLVASEEPIEVNHARFDAVRGTGAVYNDFVVVSGVDPDLRTELYGGSHEGWTWFYADIGDAGTLLRFDGGRAWFRLR